MWGGAFALTIENIVSRWDLSFPTPGLHRLLSVPFSVRLGRSTERKGVWEWFQVLKCE